LDDLSEGGVAALLEADPPPQPVGLSRDDVEAVRATPWPRRVVALVNVIKANSFLQRLPESKPKDAVQFFRFI
jgi:hypothetical protein